MKNKIELKKALIKIFIAIILILIYAIVVIIDERKKWNKREFFKYTLYYEIDYFLYMDMVLGHYRVHDGATSKDFIENHNREIEDQSMFEKFWPKWVVKVIMVFYRLAYRTYD